MGFMNKFKGFMGIPEDEYMDDEDDLDYDKDFDDEEDEEESGFGASGRRSSASSFGASEPEPSREPSPSGKVVSIHSSSQYQVVVVKPERFEDASSIADHLINSFSTTGFP